MKPEDLMSNDDVLSQVGRIGPAWKCPRDPCIGSLPGAPTPLTLLADGLAQDGAAARARRNTLGSVRSAHQSDPYHGENQFFGRPEIFRASASQAGDVESGVGGGGSGRAAALAAASAAAAQSSARLGGRCHWRCEGPGK